MNIFNKLRLIFGVCFFSLAFLSFGQGQISAPRRDNPTPKPPRPAKQQVIAESERNGIIRELEDNMVFVRGGTFMMGADNLMVSTPAHEVEVGDFYIGKYEVTEEEWYAVTGNDMPSSRDERTFPAVMHDWDAVQNFISELNRMTGKSYRLPTEAEWEWAAQGGRNSMGFTYSGSNNENDVVARREPRGSKKPNELGIYDMSGNVWELCSDYYAPFKSGFQVNPSGPDVSEVKLNQYGRYEHVMKGGDWTTGKPYEYRPQYRAKTPTSSNSLGFRLVLDYVPNDIPENIKITYLKAKSGDLTAIKTLADYYRKEKETEKYILWLKQAAGKGDRQSNYRLGSIYCDGTEVPKDLLAAEKYLSIAYKDGYSEAKAKLGIVRCDIGMSLDDTEPEEALKWFIKGAEVGDARSANNAGLYYWYGKAVKKDQMRAVSFFQQAAKQGDMHALNNMGTAYYNGFGVAKDLTKAEDYYKRAAELGHKDAAKMLSRLKITRVVVKGTDDREPLIGCTVEHLRLGHRMTAHASDIDGIVELRDVQPGDTLRISYVGYTSKEILLKSSPIHDTMEFYLSPGNYKKTVQEVR